jgi:hypothetical protein
MLTQLRDWLRRLRGRAQFSLRRIVSPTVVTDNVRIQVHDVATLRAERPDWGALSRAERAQAVRDIEPERDIVVHNTAVDELLELLVDHLDPAQNSDKQPTHLAVGDSATTPTVSNTSLNNRVGTFATSEDADQGKDLFTSTFLDSTQANGNDLKECGLKTAASGGDLLNHATFSAVSKTQNNTLTIDVTLEFRAA